MIALIAIVVFWVYLPWWLALIFTFVALGWEG